MTHTVIEMINSIEKVYKIIKPYKFFAKKVDIVEKVQYIKNYKFQTKLNEQKKRKLHQVLSHGLFNVAKANKVIDIKDICHPNNVIEELFYFYQHILECVYFRLDNAGKRLLMHYGDLATYSREWNEFTRKTRGMVVDLETKQLIVYPYDKFHNLNEIEETRMENLPDLDFEDAVKLDGSQGILYPEADGYIRIITKGSFYSEQGQFATEVLYDKYSEQLKNITLKMLQEYTFVFEILYANHDQNRIVVDYGEEPDLRIIGIRDLRTLEMLPYSEVLRIASELGFPATEVETMTLDKMLEERANRKNFEGWVRRYSNGLYLKIKCDEYIEHHGAKFGSTEKAVWHLLRNNTWDDFIANVPKEFNQAPVVIYEKLTNFIQGKLKEINSIYATLPQIEDQKEFAQYVRDNVDPDYRAFMFTLRNGEEINYIKALLSWHKFRDTMNEFYNKI